MDALELARTAARRYGFGESVRLSAFGELTENPAFRVEDADSQRAVALRVYRPGGRPLDEIRSELAWIEALRKDDGVPTPAVLHTRDGSRVAEVDGGRPVFAAAFELVPGREADESDLPWLMPRLGEITALMHRHARAWQPPGWFTRPRWDLDTTIGATPHWGPWQAGVQDPEQRAQLERLAEVVIRRLRVYGCAAGRFGLVHADLRAANVLVAGEDVWIIDFDDCGEGWYLYDLATSLTFHEAAPNVGELIESWMESYRDVEPLEDEDAREIETFLMLRRLMVSAYVGLRPDTELAEQLRKERFDTTTCELAESYLLNTPG
jgi:Ser/Thr protein kinase RdoA (MazF antagonist)